MISNMTRVEQLLTDPTADISLDELKDELNELAQLRDKSRVAFCKRLAVAYLLLVGVKYGRGVTKDTNTKKFYEWAWKNLRSANKKQYSTGTLKSYLEVGFAANPEKILSERNARTGKRAETVRVIGNEIMKSIREEVKTKVVPITKLKERYKLPTDVAQEVNRLMTAWEQASSQARAQFIYHVTGKRVNVA